MSKTLPSSQHVPYDHIFKLVPSFGRYQKQVVFGINLLTLAMGFQFDILIFGYGTPQFQCNSANNSCPMNQCCKNCTSYVFLGPFNSFVSEFNLICDRAYLGATVQSCFYGGMLFGGLVAGIMSDVCCRRITIYIFTIIMVASSAGSFFATRIVTVVVLRFVAGAGTIGLNTAFYVYFMEHVGPSSRALVSTVHGFYWSAGTYLFVFTAYFVREWRHLVLATSLVGLLLYLFCGVLPRSPRWLVAHGHLDEAHAVIMKYGGKKGKSIDPEVLKTLIEEIRKGEIEQAELKKRTKPLTPLDLFKTPKIRKRVFIMMGNWFGLVFIGNAFFLYINNLSGDIYVNLAIFNTFPALLVPVSGIMLHKFGRRLSTVAFMSLTGVLCLCNLAVPEEYASIRTGLFITAYSVCSMNWNGMSVMMSELFPTVLRTTSLGIVMTFARSGGVLSPYMAVLGQLTGLYFTLPLIIFGTVSISVALLTLLLPETLFSNMHQTIEETEAAKEYYGMPCCYKPEMDDVEMPFDNMSYGDLGTSRNMTDGGIETKL